MACFGILWGVNRFVLQNVRHLCEQMCKNHCKTQQDIAFWNLPPEAAEAPEAAEVVSASAAQTPLLHAPAPSGRPLGSLWDACGCLRIAFGSLWLSFGVPSACLGIPFGVHWIFCKMNDIFASKCAKIMLKHSKMWEPLCVARVPLAPFVSLWVPLLGALGLPSSPFGIPLAPFVSPWGAFGSLWASFGVPLASLGITWGS